MALTRSSTPASPSASPGSTLPAKCTTAPCPLPPPPVTVKIQFDCRRVAKNKNHTFTAVGSPAGGTFRWVTPAQLTVVSGGDTDVVKVTGAAVSAGVDASELAVEYTHPLGSAHDSIRVTVYEVRRITAKLLQTPCWSGATPSYNPAKSSTADSRTFDATATTVVRGCGDLELEATVAPVGVPISWAVERAADDAGLTGVPTDAAAGPDTRRKLTADAVGSFHVTAFVDCDGDGSRGAEDGGIILNVNIVDVEIMAGAANNRIIRNNTLFNAVRSSAAMLIVDSGSTGGTAPGVNAAYGDGTFAGHPLAMKVTVKLTAGGPDNRRGTDNVRLGFIQSGAGSSFRGNYADGRTLKEALARNPAVPNPILGGTPSMRGYPIRDTRGTSRRGPGPFIISSSDVQRSNLSSGGIRRVCRYVDPPAVMANFSHPVTGSALASISGSNNFEVFLSAYSRDFDRNYAVVASATWSIHFGTYSAAAGWTSAGVSVTAASSMTPYSPPKRGQDTEVKRCPPNFVDAWRLDAR